MDFKGNTGQLPDPGKNKIEKERKGKMKTRFLLQCIFPAALVMGIVCYISIMFTSTMASKNMLNSLDGQQTSKLQGLENNIDVILNESQINSCTSEVLGQIEHKAPVESLNQTVNRLSSLSSVLSKVYIAVFDEKTVIGSRGYTAEYTGEEYWVRSEMINQGKSYIVESPDVSDRDISLFTFVYPIVSSTGKSVGAIALSTNDNVLISMIGMSTNLSEQVWFIMDKNNEIYYCNKSSPDIDALASVAVDFGNDSPNIKVNGSMYIMRTSNIKSFDNYKLVYTIPLEPIIRQSYPTMVLLIVISLFSILMVVVFVMRFSGKIVTEINDVRRSVKGIYEDDFVKPMEIKTNDEMGQLVNEFNGVIDKLKYQAEHDSKTGFYNSEAFAKKSREYIQADNKRSYAIIRVDIDNFSFINDIFDWEVGDMILLGIAGDISRVFGNDAVYGYLGNDVFVVCIGYVFRDAIIQKIERANEEIKKSTEKYMPITAHFGICENATDDMDISILCDYAGIALKTVKGNLLKIYAVYDEKFDENHKVQKFVESNKISALENNDFYIVLQPKCNIFSGEVIGAEALVRWKDHVSGEIISPGKFIPIFEKNGFVITLDRFVWEETCKVIKKWREHGHKDIPVSVNVSRMHIIHDTFVDDFADLVAKYDIPPELIEVEITESALLENSEDALLEVMQGLKSKGFKLLMDDFASGYSSLIALQRLPFDVIKIDKGLIDKIGEGFNRQFVSGIIAFLKEIKKDIVIEGVEFDWQKEILKETGGTVIQGFCFSRPVPVSDFEKLAFGEEIPE